MYIVEIKHLPGAEKSYWFEVPAAMAGLIQKGDTVICETRFGEQPGIAQTGVLSGDGIERVAQAAGAKLPMRRILAVTYKIPMEGVKLHSSMAGTKPAVRKLAKRIEEFYETGAFNTKIAMSADGYLNDGYTAYLVAKMFDLDYIPIRIASPLVMLAS